MESKIIELETLTPLFIKGKEEKYGEGFIRIGNDVFLIDNDKLCKYIAESNKISEYAQYFSYRESDVKSFLVYHAIELPEHKIFEYEEDEKKFKKFLNNRNKKLQRFEDYQSYKDLSISYFLDKEGIFPSELRVKKDLAKGITRLSSGNTFTQNGVNRYYIPGSSLKGAIRNAVLFKIFSDADRKTWLNNFVSAHLTSALTANNSEKKKYKEHFSAIANSSGETVLSKSFTELIPKKNIPNNVMQEEKERFEEFNRLWESANKILRDFFRIVKISDANFVGDVTIKNEAAKAVCKDATGIPPKNQSYQKKFDINLECVPAKTKALFKISIDLNLAADFFPSGIPFYLQSVSNLLETVDEFFRTLADFEEKVFFNGLVSIPFDISPEDSKNAKLKVNTIPVLELYKQKFGLNEELLFRTGWGGGFMSKTQFLHLTTPDRVRLRDMIRYNGSPLAPKSRCLIVEGENATKPLGWCKLRVLGDAKDKPLPSIDEAKIRKDFLTERPRQSGRQYRQGSRQERTVTEKEIQQSKAEANAILKQAKKQKATASQKIYKKGDKVETTVENSVLFQSVVVKINNQTMTLQTNMFKKPGDPAYVEITEINDGIIITAKLLK